MHCRNRRVVEVLTVALCLANAALVGAQQLRSEALDAMQRAAGFYHQQLAVHGGYVYYYSPDLTRRMGEGVASPTQIWVQPPGTPTVGLAFLDAWQATQDPAYLNAATDAATALVYGQLASGAWTNSIDFDLHGQTAQYRNGRGRGRNFSTLDDGISQSAIRLLMHVDRALSSPEAAALNRSQRPDRATHRQIQEAARIALTALLNAQFTNGGFPQGWDETPADDQPLLSASYPQYDWRTEGRIKEYWDRYTLNDGVAGNVAETLQDAYAVYGEEQYLSALRKLGDFLLLAQMPEPQPAWAQQYGYDMKPIWARKFEPPAIAGRESQDVLKTLLLIYRLTADDKYLQPIPAALKYLRASALPDGQLARYYELQSNRPLYMTRSGDVYSLTYDDSNLPSHYGWKVENELDLIAADYAALIRGDNQPRVTRSPTDGEIRRLIGELDSAGRWITTFNGEPLSGQPKFRPGDQYISSDVFSQNLTDLSHYVGGP